MRLLAYALEIIFGIGLIGCCITLFFTAADDFKTIFFADDHSTSNAIHDISPEMIAAPLR